MKLCDLLPKRLQPKLKPTNDPVKKQPNRKNG